MVLDEKSVLLAQIIKLPPLYDKRNNKWQISFTYEGKVLTTYNDKHWTRQCESIKAALTVAYERWLDKLNDKYKQEPLPCILPCDIPCSESINSAIKIIHPEFPNPTAEIIVAWKFSVNSDSKICFLNNATMPAIFLLDIQCYIEIERLLLGIVQNQCKSIILMGVCNNRNSFTISHCVFGEEREMALITRLLLLDFNMQKIKPDSRFIKISPFVVANNEQEYKTHLSLYRQAKILQVQVCNGNATFGNEKFMVVTTN